MLTDAEFEECKRLLIKQKGLLFVIFLLIRLGALRLGVLED